MNQSPPDDFNLHEIYCPKDVIPLADVVFIHGLGGDARDTWTHNPNPQTKLFWPEWLSKEFSKIRILSLSHPSKILSSFFKGEGMSLLERAEATLALLHAQDVGKRPVIFVTHSLGGLIVKALLRKAVDNISNDNQRFIEKMTGVVFLATPHLGASLASIANCTGIASAVTHNLTKANEQLDDLSKWYKNQAPHKNFKTMAFYETQGPKNILVVDRQSADPNVQGCSPIPVDKDHIGICKFESDNNSTYKMIRDFILKSLSEAGIDLTSDDTRDDLEYYQTVIAGDRLSLEEKLKRGGRDDEIADAEREKERLSKLIDRNNLSNTSKKACHAFLGDVLTAYRLHVKPLINQKSSIIEVNKSIANDVIKPVLQKQYGQNFTMNNDADIHAAIYYLTGKCHVSWGEKDED